MKFKLLTLTWSLLFIQDLINANSLHRTQEMEALKLMITNRILSRRQKSRDNIYDSPKPISAPQPPVATSHNSHASQSNEKKQFQSRIIKPNYPARPSASATRVLIGQHPNILSSKIDYDNDDEEPLPNHRLIDRGSRIPSNTWLNQYKSKSRVNWPNNNIHLQQRRTGPPYSKTTTKRPTSNSLTVSIHPTQGKINNWNSPDWSRYKPRMQQKSVNNIPQKQSNPIPEKPKITGSSLTQAYLNKIQRKKQDYLNKIESNDSYMKGIESNINNLLANVINSAQPEKLGQWMKQLLLKKDYEPLIQEITKRTALLTKQQCSK